ncbi:NUDIX domain-containing protein [Shimazuella sp. AN120528]|uniref:NUDIX hydrolase n=1 Tax=Shimazuella soli TaxID=1892854 RepID=UPI001F10DA4F|nr:NUDIX domain-containing protein [Shimazuella soli]MCH5583854.1 NUDIX domain-containing protein [Shimazuella soli]
MRKEISAGGVVFRKVMDEIQLLLIQDRFGKITLPKGHQEAGETIEQTAIREIEEETGVVGKIVTKIDTISYIFTHPEHGEVEKEVTYYVVQTDEDSVSPQLEEINEVVWYSIEEARELHKANGYDNNQSILEKAIQYITKENYI